jgi:hypothetical protein
VLSVEAQLQHVDAQLLATGGAPKSEGVISIDPWDVTGVLDLDLVYPTGHQLSVYLAIDVSFGYPLWIQYSFHLQDSRSRLLFRYDNAPHHRDVPSFPHHKHVRYGAAGRGSWLTSSRRWPT